MSSEEDHIKVVCRVRPANDREKKSALGTKSSVTVDALNNAITVNTKPKPLQFNFDYVADESIDQNKVFNKVGKFIITRRSLFTMCECEL